MKRAVDVAHDKRGNAIDGELLADPVDSRRSTGPFFGEFVVGTADGVRTVRGVP